MISKRSWIVLLVGVNLLLLAVLVLGSYSLPAAFAQAGGRPGSYVCVAAKAQGQNYDVAYVLDAGADKLHALHPAMPGRGAKYKYAGFRDLNEDFK